MINDYQFKNDFRRILISNSDLIRDSLSLENKKIYDDGKAILAKRGKANTLVDNPLFSYDLVAKICPVVGITYATDLISYDSGAIKELLSLINEGKSLLIIKVLDFNQKWGIVPNDSKAIHYLTKSLSFLEPLFIDIFQKEVIINNNDIVYLRRLIYCNNRNDTRFSYILNLDDLRNYDSIFKRIPPSDTGLSRLDFYYLRSLIAYRFDCSYFNQLKRSFLGFNLHNFKGLNLVVKRLVNDLGEDAIKDKLFTYEEMNIIFILRKIFNYTNREQHVETLNYYVYEYNDGLGIGDLALEYNIILNKVRWLYTQYYNLEMTRIEEIDKKVISNTKRGKLYEITDNKFKVVGHKINNFDPCCSSAFESLCNDFTLWDKLEGSNTLSLSTFSALKSFLSYPKKNDVFFLFDHLNPSFLLYMSYCDICITHGKNVFNSEANDVNFASYDAICKMTDESFASWNEIAGNREGMIPDAILVCTKDVSDEVFEAAKYFSMLNGKEVPILYYDFSKVNLAYSVHDELFNRFKVKPNIEDLKRIMYSLTDEFVDDLAQYITSVLIEKFNNGEMSLDELISYFKQLLIYLFDMVGLAEDTEMKEYKKICLQVNDLLLSLCFIKKYFVDITNLKVFDMSVVFDASGKKYNLWNNVVLSEEAQISDSMVMKMGKYKNIFLNRIALKLESLFGVKMTREHYVWNVKKSSIFNYYSSLDDEEVKDYSNNNVFHCHEYINDDYSDFKYIRFLTGSNDVIKIKEEKVDGLIYQLLINMVISYLLGYDYLKYGDVIVDDESIIINRNNSSFITKVDNNIFELKDLYYDFFKNYQTGIFNIDFNILRECVSKICLLTDEEYLSFFSEYLSILDNKEKELFIENILRKKNNLAFELDKFIASFGEEDNLKR